MTLTREWRSGIALTLAVLLGLTAFVWGNQRQVHAESLAEDILCWIDTTGGVHPPVPYFNVGDCGDGPVVPPPPQCWDGIDNDDDGKTDWSPTAGQGDPGCDTPTDNDESDDPVVPPPAQCDDDLDNDNDGLIDFPADPGCTGTNDDTESPNPNGTGPECSDGVDNDGDNLVDSADLGCSNPQDDDETNDTGGGGGSPQCSDGSDNDQDGLTDFPADPGCSDAQDDDETDPSSGGSNNNNDNGGGSSHHSSGSFGNSRGEVLGAAVCTEFLQSYVRYGAQNDPEQVARLQYVLRQFEGAQIQLTSVYDAATLAAVNAFQRKYAGEILAPWNLKAPTGYVYYTTRKKINEVFCQGAQAFPLTAAQLQEVAGVSVLNQAGPASGATIRAAQKPTAPAAQGATLPPQQQLGDQTQADEETTGTNNAAATATTTPRTGTSWWDNFWKWLFGR
ncbi:MAG TPA: hypothetical protein VJJ20_03425 [Candidatus Paceibacterota bacterium]